MLRSASTTIEKTFFTVFSIILFVSLGTVIYTGFYPLLALPVVFLVAYISIVDYKQIFYLFFFLLPFSVEIYLPNGLGTDLPSEPLMLLLSLISLLIFIRVFPKIDRTIIRHPLVVLLVLHLFWIFFTSITSEHITVSFKYFLAKTWYLAPFFFLPLFLIDSKEKIYKWVVVVVVSVTIAATYVFIRHTVSGYDFVLVNQATSPFFRNHVSYAALLAITLPFVWWLWKMDTRGGIRKFILLLLLLFFIVAIYFSYTRAAQLCIVICALGYYVFKFRLAKIAIYSSLFVLGVLVVSLVSSNRYLDFAPDFEKTITHDNFDNLVSATAKGQDLSTMERVYRWVAGARMIKDKPVLGFGPGTFFFSYKEYGLSEFKTYVSNNPDKSGIHNYYLMVFVEQGFMGFALFMLIVVLSFIYGEGVYHRISDPSAKLFMMACLLSLLAIAALLIINDLVETDKIGPFFFFNIAMVVVLDRLQKKGQI